MTRPRRLLEKLKHKASALVLRAPAPPKTPRAVFSRPASLVTAASPPPSPTKSARSFSTASSASPTTPTTDLFAPRPSTSPTTSRWSLSTDESASSLCHPYASTHDVTSADPDRDPDPFAKGRVQVVRTSADYPSYTYAFAKRRSHPRLAPSPSPATPKPDWTLALPTTPPRLARARSSLFHSDASDSSDSHPHSLCPSAWHPAPPSPPRTRAHRRRTRVLQPPPRTPDAAAVSPSPASSAPTLRERERERARALAALNGEVHPRALEAFAPRHPDDAESELAYYSARSSFAGELGSRRGAPGRGQVRPFGC
ncbi:hypothetical protein C0993_000764 [Termitomyces sp. T159_Od127]|nr:hypothetical protein C0993_000764 [Termitomyces sp. T159_Od127]